MQHELFSKCINNVKLFWPRPWIWSVQLCNGLLYVVVLFVLYILTAYCCNFDFNFYYPRINKDKIDVTYLKYFKYVIIKYNLWCAAGENWYCPGPFPVSTWGLRFPLDLQFVRSMLYSSFYHHPSFQLFTTTNQCHKKNNLIDLFLETRWLILRNWFRVSCAVKL